MALRLGAWTVLGIDEWKANYFQGCAMHRPSLHGSLATTFSIGQKLRVVGAADITVTAEYEIHSCARPWNVAVHGESSGNSQKPAYDMAWRSCKVVLVLHAAACKILGCENKIYAWQNLHQKGNRGRRMVQISVATNHVILRPTRYPSLLSWPFCGGINITDNTCTHTPGIP